MKFNIESFITKILGLAFLVVMLILLIYRIVGDTVWSL
jgi:hypothetical protein